MYYSNCLLYVLASLLTLPWSEVRIRHFWAFKSTAIYFLDSCTCTLMKINLHKIYYIRGCGRFKLWWMGRGQEDMKKLGHWNRKGLARDWDQRQQLRKPGTHWTIALQVMVIWWINTWNEYTCFISYLVSPISQLHLLQWTIIYITCALFIYTWYTLLVSFSPWVQKCWV